MSIQNPLESVIGVNEASELWGLTPGTVKNYCAEGTIISKKIGKQWIIWADQPNPVRREGRLESVRAKQQEDAGDDLPASEDASLVEAQEDPEKPAPEPPPYVIGDLSYFAELYQECIEWDGATPEVAAEKIRAILKAYGHSDAVVEDAMARIQNEGPVEA